MLSGLGAPGCVGNSDDRSDADTVTTTPPKATVEVLTRLDNDFSEFATGFCSGKYLLWLGSGISRDIVPNVPTMLRKVLEFVRSRIEPTNPHCRFGRALDDMLTIAGLPSATLAAIDRAVTVHSWASIEDIVNRLQDKYSDVLDIPVDGEAEDYLVWTAIDVVGTYGDPHLEPGAEHLCVAILMLEGTIKTALTTNWDGLVESAMAQLSGDVDRYLDVIVRAEDFSQTRDQVALVKFHGCAVRAGANETEYRRRLIARKFQISGWNARPENARMKGFLEHQFAVRNAFIAGLSVQDENIQSIFHQAIESLHRDWPHTPPAVVFAEEGLHLNHRHVLRTTYGDATYTTNRYEIDQSAVLGAYAKPALIALVLLVLTDKLVSLISYATETPMSAPDIARLGSDLRDLRDFAAGHADADPRGFVESLGALVTFALSIFTKGCAPDPAAPSYHQISVLPIAAATINPYFPSASLGRLAIAIALLARGLVERLWKLGLGEAASPSRGVVQVISFRQMSRLFFVRDPNSLSQLQLEGIIDLDDDKIVIVQADAGKPPATRSPAPSYGRIGASGARQVIIEDLYRSVDTADELYEAFRLGAVLP